MKGVTLLFAAVLLLLSYVDSALATPSKIIWIPSPDVQPCLVGHLDIDTYLRSERNSLGGRDPNIIDVGFLIGVLPYEKVQMELGFDYLTTGTNPNDQHPWSGNIKLGTPEDSMFDFSPAIVVGLYNARAVKDIEVKDSPYVYSGQNIVYGLVAKTVPAIGAFPSLGRFSLGYYRGTHRALRDNKNQFIAEPSNTGFMFSWDRRLSEISDKLWFGVDFQGGDNIDSSWNAGFAWNFSKNVSVTFGYDWYNKTSLSGENTFTTQLNLNFP